MWENYINLEMYIKYINFCQQGEGLCMWEWCLMRDPEVLVSQEDGDTHASELSVPTVSN